MSVRGPRGGGGWGLGNAILYLRYFPGFSLYHLSLHKYLKVGNIQVDKRFDWLYCVIYLVLWNIGNSVVAELKRTLMLNNKSCFMGFIQKLQQTNMNILDNIVVYSETVWITTQLPWMVTPWQMLFTTGASTSDILAKLLAWFKRFFLTFFFLFCSFSRSFCFFFPILFFFLSFFLFMPTAILAEAYCFTLHEKPGML